MTGFATDMHGRTTRARVTRVWRTAACRFAVLIITAVTVVAAVPMSAAASQRAESAPWTSVFDAVRPVPAVDTRRVIVEFSSPSLGEWSAASDRPLTAAESRLFVRRARAEQERTLERIRAAGVQFRVEHRYLRVLNGASIVVHGDNAQAIRGVRGVASVSQVRVVYPALATVSADATENASMSGGGASHRTGFPTVAVLDTGIDFNHGLLQGHQASPGLDVVSKQVGVEVNGSDEHGTNVAGAVVGGAGGRVDLVPVRIMEYQPVFGGLEAVVGSSDALLAGMEYAVDPNADGVADDHADVILAAVTEPYASFTRSVEERAVAAAAGLGSITVAAAGNDGASGDEVGTVGGPAAAQAALAIGAADLRPETLAASVHARGGLLDVAYRDLPLVTRGVDVPEGDMRLLAIDGGGDDVVDYLGDDARSRVAGNAVIIGTSTTSTLAERVRAAADAGAVAVLVSGAGERELGGLVEGAGLDVPAVGMSEGDASALAQAARESDVRISLTVNDHAENDGYGRVAGFSSRGPRFDGIGKPDLVAAGVGVRTSAPGRSADGADRYVHVSGTSIAAAHAAGAVASLVAQRPSWSVERIRAAVIGSAIPLGSVDEREPIEAQGAGVIDVTSAAGRSVTAQPARIEFGVREPGETARKQFQFVDANGEALAMPVLRVERSGGTDPQISIDGNRFVVSIPESTRSGVYGGWLVNDRDEVRVPWSVTVRRADGGDVPIVASLDRDSFAPSSGRPGAFPALLQVTVGGAPTGDSLGVRAVQKLEVRLVTKRGRVVGTLAAFDHLLPGVYMLGITGSDDRGAALAPGRYSLRIRSVSAANPGGTWVDGPTVSLTIKK